MSEGANVAEVFLGLALLAEHDGVGSINQLPGCWQREFEPWTIWLNGHEQPRKGGPRDDIEVPPYHCYIEFNGWPAGLVTPRGGTIAAGSAANEDSFIAAIETIIGRRIIEDDKVGAM